MGQELVYEQKGISFSEIFTEFLSDITLEVEAIKIKAMRKDVEGIKEHVERINSALSGITDAKLDLAEIFASQSS